MLGILLCDLLFDCFLCMFAVFGGDYCWFGVCVGIILFSVLVNVVDGFCWF